jgi:tripartite-type tricarboxylate transporter receptor subunit TctC
MTTDPLRRLGLLAAVAAAVAALLPRPAAAAYPERPVQIVVPFAPGGALDAIARIVAQRLADNTGKTFVVDNKAGASGNIGSQAVARAAPDGYTVLFTSFTTAAITQAMQGAGTGYGLNSDLLPFATVGSLPVVMITGAESRLNSVADVLRTAKARPDALSFGSAGKGSIEHVAGELFKREARIDLLHVPYKGGAPAMNDLLGGQVQLMFATSGTAVSALKTGRAKALAVAGPQRLKILPEVPTLQEQGVAGVDVSVVYGFLAPAGTPAEATRYLQAEIDKALQQPETAGRLGQLSVEVLSASPAQSAALLTQQMSKWGRVVKDADIKAD